MSYRLTQFASETLPTDAYRIQADVGAQSRSLRTTRGRWDSYGTNRTPLALPYMLRYTSLIYNSGGISNVGSTFDLLRKYTGQRQKLYATSMEDDSERWAWARLVMMTGGHDYSHRSTQPVEMLFEVMSPWYGTGHGLGWYLDAGYLLDDGLFLDTGDVTALDASPKNVTVTNDGNYPVEDMIIRVTAAGTAITALTVGIANICQFTFTGSIAPATALRVDTTNYTVTNGGTGALANFAVTANHVIEPWFRLASGNNTVVVTKTGGSADSTIGFEFWDAWA